MEHTIHMMAGCPLPCSAKTGIRLWREHFSRLLDVLEYEHLPTQDSYDDKLYLATPMRMIMSMSFSEIV